MASLVAASKPFSPTIHVLILPTQLPLDMRHAFRDLDELALVRFYRFNRAVQLKRFFCGNDQNGGFVPDHMNILSTQQAIEHVRGLIYVT